MVSKVNEYVPFSPWHWDTTSAELWWSHFQFPWGLIRATWWLPVRIRKATNSLEEAHSKRAQCMCARLRHCMPFSSVVGPALASGITHPLKRRKKKGAIWRMCLLRHAAQCLPGMVLIASAQHLCSCCTDKCSHFPPQGLFRRQVCTWDLLVADIASEEARRTRQVIPFQSVLSKTDCHVFWLQHRSTICKSWRKIVEKVWACLDDGAVLSHSTFFISLLAVFTRTGLVMVAFPQDVSPLVVFMHLCQPQELVIWGTWKCRMQTSYSASLVLNNFKRIVTHIYFSNTYTKPNDFPAASTMGALPTCSWHNSKMLTCPAASPLQCTVAVNFYYFEILIQTQIAPPCGSN